MVWALPISLATTLGIVVLLSFPMGTKMFQFPTFPSIYYFTHIQIYSLFLLYEFPHSDIYGLMDICSSPQLFAAYHVLLRLLVPRHSPYALCSLTYFQSFLFKTLVLFIVNNFSMFNIVSLFFFWLNCHTKINISLHLSQYASLPFFAFSI